MQSSFISLPEVASKILSAKKWQFLLKIKRCRGIMGRILKKKKSMFRVSSAVNFVVELIWLLQFGQGFS